MDIKKGLLLGLIITLLVGGIITTVFLVRQNQDIRSRADEGSGTTSPSPTVVATATPTAAACQVPTQILGLQLEYPYCSGADGLDCSFTKAVCTWDAVTGATSYKVKIFQVESGQVVIDGSVNETQQVFDVVQDKTYQCEVAAVNSCGTGATAADSLLCAVGGVFPTSTPTPTATPVPVALACGAVGCSATQPCQAGNICVQAANGQSYCANPAYQTACQQNGTTAACCTAPTPAPIVTPTPMPVLPKSGENDALILMAVAGLGLIGFAGASMTLPKLKRKR